MKRTALRLLALLLACAAGGGIIEAFTPPGKSVGHWVITALLAVLAVVAWRASGTGRPVPARALKPPKETPERPWRH